MDSVGGERWSPYPGVWFVHFDGAIPSRFIEVETARSADGGLVDGVDDGPGGGEQPSLLID